MRMTEVDGGSELLSAVYEEVLRPAFPAEELESLESLRAAALAGRAVVSTVVDDEEQPQAVAVGDMDEDSGVLLLSYLAVRPGVRSSGLGGRLMREVAEVWQPRFRPLLTLVEVENPRGRGAHREHGDPAARLRFYARHGGRALDVPFFQPALPRTGRRVPDMLLVVLPPCPPTDAEGRLPGAAVRTFLAGYLREYEGGPGDDPGVRALWQAVDRPGGIPLLPLDDLDALPLSSAPR